MEAQGKIKREADGHSAVTTPGKRKALPKKQDITSQPAAKKKKPAVSATEGGSAVLAKYRAGGGATWTPETTQLLRELHEENPTATASTLAKELNQMIGFTNKQVSNKLYSLTH